MSRSSRPVEVSVIVPVGRRHSDLASLYSEYRLALTALGRSFECIFVVDGPQPDAAPQLDELLQRYPEVVVVGLTRVFGEATALMAGVQQAAGEIIITLPAYHQIEAADISKLVKALDSADLAIGRRHPRVGGFLERMRRNAFHRIIAGVTGVRYNDLGCGARAMKRRVLEEISLYGDQHRFLPLLADRQGFRIAEIEVRQHAQDRFDGHYKTREYAHRTLDIFTVFFLTRFTKKPLRFFGMVGAITFGVGVALTAWLVIDRLFFGVALADRPAFLLSSLLVVLGLQLLALGLLGELMIFTHARDIKDYQVDQIVHFPEASIPAERTALSQ